MTKHKTHRNPDDNACVACAGFGIVKGEDCWICNGTGREPDEDDEDNDEEE